MNLIAPFNAGYDAALEACGRNPADYDVSVMVPVCVADTTDKAWEIAGPGIEYFVNFYQMRKNLQGEPAPAEARITQEMLRTGNAGFWFAAVGTPEDVIGKLRPFVDGHLGRITQLALQMRQPGMSNDDTHRSMRMFASEVIPAPVVASLAKAKDDSKMAERSGAPVQKWSLPSTVISSTVPPAARSASVNSTLCA